MAARTRGHTPARDRAVSAFSRTGDHGMFWVGLSMAGAAAVPQRRPAMLRAAGTVAVAYCVNQAIKLAVRRRRPEIPGLPPLSLTLTKLSFPSAHATTAACGARMLTAAGAPPPVVYGLAGVFAYSRLYLGVHHPSDVLVGAALGTAIAEVALR